MASRRHQSMAIKVAIVTDSMSCLNRELVSQNGIRIVPATLSFAGRVYRDGVDIAPTEAYELFLKDPESFSSSAAIPMDYIEAYRELGKQDKDILCITLSSRLSGMHDIARTAKKGNEGRLLTLQYLTREQVLLLKGLLPWLRLRQPLKEGICMR